MISNVEEHFTDEDIIKLNMKAENKRWKEELLFNANEIHFYLKVLESDFTKKISLNSEDLNYLLCQLENVREANNAQLEGVMDFENKLLGGMNECDDVQCENHYVQDHLILKIRVEKHLENFRLVKGTIYKHLEGGLERIF